MYSTEVSLRYNNLCKTKYKTCFISAVITFDSHKNNNQIHKLSYTEMCHLYESEKLYGSEV